MNWSFTLKDEFILLSKDGEKINKMYVIQRNKQYRKKHFSKGKLLNQNVQGLFLISCLALKNKVLYKETQNTNIYKLDIDEKKGNKVGTLSEMRNKSNIKNALKIRIRVLYIHKVNSLQFQLQANRCLIFDE